MFERTQVYRIAAAAMVASLAACATDLLRPAPARAGAQMSAAAHNATLSNTRDGRGGAIAPTGRLPRQAYGFVSDLNSNAIYVVNRDGRLIATLSGNGLDAPLGIAVDPANDKLYVANSTGTTSSSIRRRRLPLC